jgi:hypothetical protein
MKRRTAFASIAVGAVLAPFVYSLIEDDILSEIAAYVATCSILLALIVILLAERND